ncbi:MULTISPECIES: SDR family NAD(P)-dependent oxidoreductase [Salinibaculum]|uniref:SDR family NAD(P)-dependent oxidoreductase n=1 Tax=Salinibaculum TaxID=2732368 RepID=UPI0030CB6CA9
MSRPPERRAGVDEADCSGTTAVVTGSTTGIGREIALSLGRLGAHVVVHGRDRERGRDVVSELDETAGSGEFVAADFATEAGVRSFADDVLDRVETVDLLFNNAGGFFRRGRLTDDGIETTFAVNHLAPFLLTHLLAPSMPDDGRVVTTSSGVHRQGGIDFDSFDTVDDYSGMTAYSQSKLANVLFTRELASRVDRLTANCFHPGFVPGSDFSRELPAPIRVSMKALSVVPGVGTSVEQGAATGVYLGVSDDVAGTSGKYFAHCSEKRPAAAARDDRTAARLWQRSEQLVGLTDAERIAPPADAH